MSDPKGDSFFGGYLGRPQRDLDVLDALYAVGAEEWATGMLAYFSDVGTTDKDRLEDVCLLLRYITILDGQYERANGLV